MLLPLIICTDCHFFLLKKPWSYSTRRCSNEKGGNVPLDFVELSCDIVERCGGLPLAIVAIGGLLSTKDKVLYGWRKLHNSLSSKLKSNPDLTDITKILSFH
jgi:disease resistance protein RPM1